MVSVFQEVASSHKEIVLLKGVRGLIDGLRSGLGDSKDVVSL